MAAEQDKAEQGAAQGEPDLPNGQGQRGAAAGSLLLEQHRPALPTPCPGRGVLFSDSVAGRAFPAVGGARQDGDARRCHLMLAQLRPCGDGRRREAAGTAPLASLPLLKRRQQQQQEIQEFCEMTGRGRERVKSLGLGW